MKQNRIYLSPPHMCGKEQKFVNEAFASGWIAPIGPMVDAFEREMCAYTGSPHAAALSSGTGAIHLALLILGVKPGDEVVCSSFTFAGSAFPVTYVGATPALRTVNRINKKKAPNRNLKEWKNEQAGL